MKCFIILPASELDDQASLLKAAVFFQQIPAVVDDIGELRGCLDRDICRMVLLHHAKYKKRVLDSIVVAGLYDQNYHHRYFQITPDKETLSNKFLIITK